MWSNGFEKDAKVLKLLQMMLNDHGATLGATPACQSHMILQEMLPALMHPSGPQEGQYEQSFRPAWHFAARQIMR